MGFQYAAVCDRCDYRSEFVWPLWACYQWPDGHTLELAQRLIWCQTCRTVGIGEALVAPEVMQDLAGLQPVKVIGNGWDERTVIVWNQPDKETALAYARYPRYKHLYEYLLQHKKWGLGQSVTLKNTLDLHLQWRPQRVSPAHCLSCGSLDFVAFGLDEHDEPRPEVHPGCGGLLHMTKLNKVRRKSSSGLWSVEGEPILVKRR